MMQSIHWFWPTNVNAESQSGHNCLNHALLTLNSVSRTMVSLVETMNSSAEGRSAGSMTVAPRLRIVSSACSKILLTYGSFPVMASSMKTLRGTPTLFPRRASLFRAFRKSGTGWGCAKVKLSVGSIPAITESTIAPSATERVMGPTVSWWADTGTTGGALSVHTQPTMISILTSCTRDQSHSRFDAYDIVIATGTRNAAICFCVDGESGKPNGCGHCTSRWGTTRIPMWVVCAHRLSAPCGPTGGENPKRTELCPFRHVSFACTLGISKCNIIPIVWRTKNDCPRLP